MRNFDYLKQIDSLKELYGYCSIAEEYQVSNPELSAINSRKALECITRIIYKLKGVEVDERDTLLVLMQGEIFLDFVEGFDLREVHYIRKIGNIAAHTGKVKKAQSYYALLDIYNFVGSVLLKLGALVTLAPFNKELIPTHAEIHPTPIQRDSLQFVENVDKSKISTQPLQKMPTNLSEEETRKLFIDLMLNEAGWDVMEEEGKVVPAKACIEIPVTGMPNGSGDGFVDYVLFGDDGNPLAVVEAKKTSVDPAKGKHQAELYAECLKARYGVMPVIYYSNGFETKVIDGLGYPPRQIYSFHSKDDLVLLIQKRSRGKITDLTINDNITDRYYQKRAIKKICEHFNAMHRRALLVMATGTGKTRVAVSLVDVMVRNGWVKNVLFLADRTLLVNQALDKGFAKFLSEYPTAVLSDHSQKIDTNARIFLSTYQTMINYIDTETKEFSVGKFDLIIIDEAHRSVFGKYGAIFDYFDSFMVGLTATPRSEVDRSTYELLDLEDGCPNDFYELDDAVNDGYLVPPKKRRMKSKVMNRGIKYSELKDREKDQFEDVWDYEKAKLDIPPDDPYWRDIESGEIFNYINNIDTIDKMLQTLMEEGQKIKGGECIGKTIIFAHRHEHAQKIVDRFNKIYPEYGPDFCVLIDNRVTYAQSLKDRFEVRDKLPQIAVSVDMLDTGIDVEDVLNLVFFKVVKSKIKFNQMIGRGTRLSKDIFGEGKDKKFFYVFDWCGNIEFFEANIDGVEASASASLTERLYCLRTDIIHELQRPEHQVVDYDRQLCETLKSELRTQVQRLNDLHISVRKFWKDVTYFRAEGSWQFLSPLDTVKLKNNIAPILSKSQEDEAAKRFDVLSLNVELSLLDTSVNARPSIRKIVNIAHKLKEKSVIPQIREKIEVLDMVLSDNFWKNNTIDRMEFVRTELRELMNLIFKEETPTFDVDVEDEVVEKIEENDAMSISTKTYIQRVFDYLAEHEDMPVLEKVKTLQPLNQVDINELERILWEELGSKEDYDRYTSHLQCGHFVAVFIRSIIGINRKVAKQMFSEFVGLASLNADQEEFLNDIINYVCENGDIEVQNLVEDRPFKDRNMKSIFGSNIPKLADYVRKIHSVVRFNDNNPDSNIAV